MTERSSPLLVRQREVRLSRASLSLSIVLAIFFLSGFSGLVYQVVWVKMLSQVFGVTTYAVSAVLAAFMGGLALGSLLGGRLADRGLDGLRVYGILEVAIGVYALAVPALFEGLTPVYRWLYPALAQSTYLLSVARAAIAFGLLVAPTTLMGATLPLLTRALVERQGELGRKVAWLYAWNTLGAVAGSLAAGFILIGVAGLRLTTLIAVALNLLAGAVALGLSAAAAAPARTRPADDAAPPPEPLPAEPQPALNRATLGLMFVSGFAALGYEVIWTRVLAVISDHSVYAFSAMLAAVLIGIGLGSTWIGQRLARLSHPARALVAAEIGLGAGAVMSLWLASLVGRWLTPIQTVLGPARVSGNAVIFFLMAMAVILLPSVCMGITFPLAAQAYVRPPGHLGRGVGSVYAANVVGAMLGSLATGFVLIPLFGSQRSLWLLAALNVAAAAWLARPAWGARFARALAGLAAAGLVAALFQPDTLYRTLFANRYLEHRILRNYEGAEATVTVTQYDGVNAIYLNGAHQANTLDLMLSIHRTIGHLPALAHGGEAPRRALVIGLGGGATSGAVLQHVEGELEIVELSAGMVEAARTTFAPHNGGVVDDPRARVVVADGRNYLLLTGARYDVITADIIPPLHAHSSNLYSLEYFQLLADHLAPGGVVSQWLDRSLMEHEQAILQRTFAAAFPHVALWQHGQIAILLGSNAPVELDYDRVAERFTPRVAADMAALGVNGAAAVVEGLTLTDADLRAALGPGLVLTDNHPYNEYFRLLRFGDLWQRLGQ